MYMSYMSKIGYVYHKKHLILNSKYRFFTICVFLCSGHLVSSGGMDIARGGLRERSSPPPF